MDEATIWQAITGQRIELADLLDGLTDEQWEAPSLCAGWRVRDVAAHLAMTSRPPGLAAILAGTVRAGGSIDRFNRDAAVRYAAARPAAALAAELRERAGSHRIPAVTDHRNILVDVLVHGQDMAVPLGLDRPVPPGPGRAAADRVWSMGWPFRARRRMRGFRLTATDTDWSAGSGAEVRAPLAALLLLLTARPAAFDRLEGAGAPALVHRLSRGALHRARP